MVIPNFIRLNTAAFDFSTERALEQLGQMIVKLADTTEAK